MTPIQLRLAVLKACAFEGRLPDNLETPAAYQVMIEFQDKGLLSRALRLTPAGHAALLVIEVLGL